eukprot:gene20034-20565_t
MIQSQGDGPDWYLYVADDPVDRTDPTGNSPFEIVLGVIDAGSLASDVHSGASLGQIALDVGNLALDVAPIPGLSEVAHVAEGVRAAEHGVEAVRTAEHGVEAAKGSLPKPRSGPGAVPKSERDPKRTFSPADRAAKQGHHIERHADGGRTDDANHAEVCKDCHRELHTPDPISGNEAERLRRNISAYGAHLSELPERAWQTSVCRWMEGYWDVLVDLFTEEEGESDLVLFIKVYEREGSYRFNVESIHADGRIAFVAAGLYAGELDHCAAARLGPWSASEAAFVDNGALTGRVGYTHPTPAVRLRPTPCRPDHPAVMEASPTELWTMAHIPVGWAAPIQPMRQAPARTRAKGVALSDPKSAGRRQTAAPAAQGAALRLRHGAADALSAVTWWERGLPGAERPGVANLSTRPAAWVRAVVAPAGGGCGGV